MRDIIAICRSGKKSRLRTAQVLDRYFWRIGDRTWRGKATNACLDRAARELRKRATRNTAVTIHEIRSSVESRMPLIRIGSASAFSDEGLVPVSTHPSSTVRRSDDFQASRAVVGLAALFHDLGKATILFQEKLKRALKSGQPEADPVRHELHSAAVWDHLFGRTADVDLPKELGLLRPNDIDEACVQVVSKLAAFHTYPDDFLDFDFLSKTGSRTQAVGLLILTHHRLPDGDTDHIGLLASRHVNSGAVLDRNHISIAPGEPFWHEDWWLRRLQRESAALSVSGALASLDIALRASLMFADHLGSAAKQKSIDVPAHLANTLPIVAGSRTFVPADSLSQHVKRVYAQTRGTFDMLHRYRDRFPALMEDQVPVEVAFPSQAKDARFAWQAEAARAAKSMCEVNGGGFFACLMAGTGTGKTRAAPTILANAALSDVRPERRYLRMNLALGLRVLATQSAKEYVDDLGFSSKDVSVLVGEAPIDFSASDDSTGSESLISIPDWMRVEQINGSVPVEGEDGEDRWIRSLSLDTDRGLPATCDMILEAAGKRADSGRRLITPPVMIGTIDHLMAIAAPVNSRFLIQTIRLMTSDLILDEIDQFDGEDIAAIGRLIYQTGAAGRRVVIMSATLTSDIAEALHTAYTKGWEAFANAGCAEPHVNLLITGDAPGSCFTNQYGDNLVATLDRCRTVTLQHLTAAPALRRGEIMPACDVWDELVAQIDEGSTRMHDAHHVEMSGFRVSVGMVRMTRIAHTAAVAAQLPTGLVRDRLRVTVCLHSNFPRLHRAWIETRLKRALTRKWGDPDAGVRALCHAEDLFSRADAAGVRDIEIVVVTSPVIETGNDLDFDYAILDPISMRSVIQSAGRVRRHRPVAGMGPNVLILGRSPIAMQNGALKRPGVESSHHKDTMVEAPSLAAFQNRNFADLAGDADFVRIDASPLISGGGNLPLRDAEAALRSAMIAVTGNGPLGRYINHDVARFNMRLSQTRKFRRSQIRDVHYFLDGETLAEAEWQVDFAPGTRESAPVAAESRGLIVDKVPGDHLFNDLTAQAWNEFSHGLAEMSSADLRIMMKASVADYGGDADLAMGYSEFTGFTQGNLEDLSRPFGKHDCSQSLNSAV
jgi:CRISPR-associated endonuclease/helicase Cas3